MVGRQSGTTVHIWLHPEPLHIVSVELRQTVSKEREEYKQYLKTNSLLCPEMKFLEQEPGMLVSSGSYKNPFHFLSLHQLT